MSDRSYKVTLNYLLEIAKSQKEKRNQSPTIDED